MGFSTFARWVGILVLVVWLTTPTTASFEAMATTILSTCALVAAVDSLSQRLDLQALGYLILALAYNPIVLLSVSPRWHVAAVLFLMAPRLKKKEPVLSVPR